jgi:tRNA-splicing endonuclease subunit Sen2
MSQPEYTISKYADVMVGKLRGRCVEIQEEYFSLYDQGTFGKGTFSRSRPIQFASEEDRPKEVLLLSLHEAFYLLYALGCLKIEHNGKTLSILECFKTFCQIEGAEFFITRYATFHYCRCRGWVTRSGVKYGCDFMLYKFGPEHDHSKFCMRVLPALNDKLFEISWRELQHQTRLSISVAKIFVAVIVRVDTHRQTIEEYAENTPVDDIFKKDIKLEMTQVTRFMP